MTSQQIGYAIISLTPAMYYLVGRVITKMPSVGLWRLPYRVLTEIRNDLKGVTLLSGFCYGLTLILPKIGLFLIIWKLGISFYLLLISIAMIMLVSDFLSHAIDRMNDQTDRINYATALPLIVSIVKIFLYFTWLMIVMAVFGVDTRPFFQGSALIAFIIGLAGQRTIQAIFGTLLIFTDRIYRVGSIVNYKEYTGRVTKITIFTTTLETVEGKSIYIKNDEINVITVIEH